MNPFVAHIVGDFILQNEWMALNKKHNSFVCAVHSIVYLTPFLLSHLFWWQLLLIGLQHFFAGSLRVYFVVDAHCEAGTAGGNGAASPRGGSNIPCPVDTDRPDARRNAVSIILREKGIGGEYNTGKKMNYRAASSGVSTNFNETQISETKCTLKGIYDTEI